MERPPLAVPPFEHHQISSSTNEACPTPANMIAHLRSKGVTLWCEDGRLKYRAVNGAISQNEITWLKVSRDSVLALLQGADGSSSAESIPHLGSRLFRAPLAFSQQAHW